MLLRVQPKNYYMTYVCKKKWSSPQNRVYPIYLYGQKWEAFISMTAKAPVRHLIGQRRPPPDAGHFCAG